MQIRINHCSQNHQIGFIMKVTKPFFILIILSYLSISCSKSSEPVISKPQILVGLNTNTNTWHLTSISINNVNQPLTLTQKNYYKKYYSDYSFETSDGYKGTWKFTNVNTLIETYNNVSINGIAYQSYTYVFNTDNLNLPTLTLQYSDNGQYVSTVYSAGH